MVKALINPHSDDLEPIVCLKTTDETGSVPILNGKQSRQKKVVERFRLARDDLISPNPKHHLDKILSSSLLSLVTVPNLSQYEIF